MTDEPMFLTGTFHTDGGKLVRIDTDRVVYRYRLPITDCPVVQLPERANILSVGPPRDGRDELDLWALVSPHAPLRPCHFRVVGTGNPMPPDAGSFIGTVPTHGGSLVWHVFLARA